ncbi:MAG TPA: hypothetical protein VMW23_02625 [Sedimentisphaerales bacterium]|nr:hypothetical protein [Sedimentisphaerales bacterium]
MVKGILIGAGVIVAGYVVYKVVQKKSPKMLKAAKKHAVNLKKRTGEIAAEARQAFRQGFAAAQGQTAA